jgi:hypothetical protein
MSYRRASTLAVKVFQAAGERASFGPSGSLLSRTATVPGWLHVTSTQFPPDLVLLRHPARVRSIAPQLLSRSGLLRLREAAPLRQGIEDQSCVTYDRGRLHHLPRGRCFKVEDTAGPILISDHERAEQTQWGS